VSWSAAFDDPVPLPRGRRLLTLRDAARYITRLPAAEQRQERWQHAAEALLLVAEHDGPTMMARIAMMRALNHGRPQPALGPRRKQPKAYKIVR